jgi:hypothetical protein
VASPASALTTVPTRGAAGYVVTLTSARGANGSMLLDVSTDRARAAACQAAVAFLRAMTPLLACPVGDRLAFGAYAFAEGPLVSLDLNVAFVPAARSEAEALARLTDQRAIWDLASAAAVPIGGGGQSRITEPHRLLGLVRERLPLLLARVEAGLPAVDVRLFGLSSNSIAGPRKGPEAGRSRGVPPTGRWLRPPLRGHPGRVLPEVLRPSASVAAPRASTGSRVAAMSHVVDIGL